MTAEIATRKLFLSFSGLLIAMREGSITQEDLNSGLFAFGCTREYALNPWKKDIRIAVNNVEQVFKHDPDLGRKVHGQIAAALLKAEPEGRATFRKVASLTRMYDLELMLNRHGMSMVREDMDGFDLLMIKMLERYPESVIEAVKAAKLPLVVVTNSIEN